MIEETKPGRDRCLSGSIQIPVHIDVRLLRGTPYDRTTLAGKQILGDLIPIIRDIGGRQWGSVSRQLTLRSLLRAQPDTFSAQIMGQLHIRKAVPDHETILQIVFTGHIFREHSRTRLTIRGIILGKGRIDQDIVEYDPLSFQRL